MRRRLRGFGFRTRELGGHGRAFPAISRISGIFFLKFFSRMSSEAICAEASMQPVSRRSSVTSLKENKAEEMPSGVTSRGAPETMKWWSTPSRFLSTLSNEYFLPSEKRLSNPPSHAKQEDPLWQANRSRHLRPTVEHPEISKKSRKNRLENRMFRFRSSTMIPSPRWDMISA